VKIGEAYERLGRTGAENAYQRVVAQFSDQAESLRAARARLHALGGSNGASVDASQTMVFADLPSVRPVHNAQFDFSPAGDRIAYVNIQGELYITNHGGTVTRTVSPADTAGYRFSPRWSPDGKHIAFVQRSRYFADSLSNALMLVSAEGGPPRSLLTVKGPETLLGPARGGLVWTNDSRALTILIRTGMPSQIQDHLVTIDLNGRRIREVPTFSPHLSQMTGYSPDGRWLAFQQPNRDSDGGEAMDVWLFPSEGGRAIQVTQAPGFDGWPAWAPDGRSLYFISDRSGSRNLWRVAIDPASGLATGDPTRVTSYSGVSILYPKVVAGGKRVAFALIRETSAIQVADVERASEARAVARGGNPVLSPDGRIIYFRGETSDDAGVFAVSVDGGEPRRVTPVSSDQVVQTFALSPDGSQVATVSQSGGDKVLAVIPASGGTPRELTRFASRLLVAAVWSPDGSRVAYACAHSMYVVPVSGGPATQVARLYGIEGWTVRWSPNGDHLAALGWEAPNQSVAVLVVPSAGGAPRRLTPESERGYKEGLEWHPDGLRLSYMSYGDNERGDGSRVAYLDGRPTSLLVNQPAPMWDYVGTWHPAGTTYYFIASDASGSSRWSSFAHDVTAGSTRLVWARQDEPGASLPSFSRDGRVIVFGHKRTTRQLWTIGTNR
jgi:Tol biopolymer transport system component